VRAVGFGACVALMVAGGTLASMPEVAWAQETIHACAKVVNGQLRIVDSPADCGPSERPLSWSTGAPELPWSLMWGVVRTPHVEGGRLTVPGELVAGSGITHVEFGEPRENWATVYFAADVSECALFTERRNPTVPPETPLDVIITPVSRVTVVCPEGFPLQGTMGGFSILAVCGGD